MVVQVRVDVPEVVDALNTTDVGLKEQTGGFRAPPGPTMLEVKLTVPAKPLMPLAVTVVAAGDPGATLLEVGLVLTLNAGLAIVKFAGEVLVLAWKLTSPE